MSDKQKVAIVTGAGSGIGKCIAKALTDDGAKVFILDRDLDAAEEVASGIRATGDHAEAFGMDVSNFQEVHDVIEGIAREHGVDILVNNAGIAYVGTIESTSEEDLDRIYDVNVKGVYNCTRAVIGPMKEQNSGVIINLASVASTVGLADRFAYSMSKGAVLTMTLSVAKDYVGHGIRCNCIAPGRIHTPFVEGFLEKNYPENKQEMFEQLSASQPVGRMGRPEEVASLVKYLCSDDASFITGSNFPIDGGFVTLNS